MRTWTCGHFSTRHGVCGEITWSTYLIGPRCAAHTPARLAGRPEAAPDPALTLRGFRKAARVEKIRARAAAENAANDVPGWTTTPPTVSPEGWISQPGRKFTTADVDMGKVRRAFEAVGRDLERTAQIRRVAAREAAP